MDCHSDHGSLPGCFQTWALLLPVSLLPVKRGWMSVGHVLGWINTRIILGIMFYILFLPAGLVMRLLRKGPMARTIDKSQKNLSGHPYTPEKEPYRETLLMLDLLKDLCGLMKERKKFWLSQSFL